MRKFHPGKSRRFRGYSMETQDLILPVIVLGIILFMLILGVFNRVIAKLGLRNFYRHKGHAIISIIGLLVGTSIICASMVVGDSIEYFIVEETYDNLQHIDMVVSGEAGTSFNESIFTSLDSNADVNALTDGMAPLYAQSVTVRHSTTNQFEPSTNLIGFDSQEETAAEFGYFMTHDGQEILGNDLGANDSMINFALAENLGANEGDTIVLTYSIGGSYGGYGQIETRAFTIQHILEDTGKTLYNPLPGMSFDIFNVFVNMDTAQEMFFEPDMITHIKISNIGGIEDGAENSEEVQATLESALSGYTGIEVDSTKQEHLDMAKAFNDLISTFLTIFGSFAIIAGVILIINIFTMLAEERKSELGMARAVGMKRKHLMQAFLFEGVTYGVVASAIGTLVGVGVGMALIWMVNNFITFIDISLPFKFQWFSLISAFSLGFIITFGTILFTSWKISKLNIIRAIRGIEEPVKDRKGYSMLLLGALITLVSSLLYWQLPDEVLVMLVAPSGIIAGLGLILWRWIGDRIAITGGSLGVFLYTYYAIRTLFNDVDTQSMDVVFIVSGVIIVLSLVLLIMYNSGPVIRLITGSFGRVRKWRPTIETAVSYPLTKKFRTGMSVAMFALVIYMIVMLSVFSNMFTIDLDEETMKQGGGYDIQAEALNPVMDLGNVSFFEPTYNMTIQINSDALQNNLTSYAQLSRAFTMDANITDSEVEAFNFGGIELDFMSFSYVYGIDQAFHEGRSYQFTGMAEDYDTPDDVWSAVTAPGSTSVILSGQSAMFMGAEAGNHITVRDPMTNNVSQEYVIAGIVDQSMLSGIFMSRDNVMLNFGMMGMVNSVFMFEVADGYDVEATARTLESDFAALGMNAVVVREIAETTMETMNSMFVLFELYLDMGMVVGVAGLGIITIRSVVERTPEIGILRSLGFKRSNIRNAFLIEILFVATLGMLIGVVTGVMVSYEIFNMMVGDMGNIVFEVPWFKIAYVTAIAYAATILCTIIPARNAAKIAPAEALRYVG